MKLKSLALMALVFLSILILPQLSPADRTVRRQIAPNIYKTYRIKDADPKPVVNWRERRTTKTTGSGVEVKKEILHESVCYDYEEGSLAYRDCRQAAREHFREQCDIFDKKYRGAKRPYDKWYEVERDKFCRAATGFSP